MDLPLYDGASLTRGNSYLLIHKFCLKHKLSGIATGDLLKLIEAHCPQPNLCCPSLYFLKTSCAPSDTFKQYHKYCSTCFCLVTDNYILQQCSKCGDELKGSYFIQLNLEEQLQCLFKSETHDN